MSTEKKKPGPLTQIAAGFVILAAITGLYLFQATGRKAATEDTATPSPMAAFLVKAERKPLAPVAFQDGTGKVLTLADWKGRVVLVNLWATWCAPCRKEMPDLAALQEELGSDQFEVVAISVDRKGIEASAAFLKETGAGNLKLYIEPSADILGALEAIGLPVTILIDRRGREIGRLIGPAEWASPEAKALITAALAEKP